MKFAFNGYDVYVDGGTVFLGDVKKMQKVWSFRS